MLSIILKYVKQYKKYALLTPLFVAGEVICELLIPYQMSIIVDKGITLNNMDIVIKYGLVMALLALMSLVFGSLAGKYAAIASAGFASNLRQAEFESIQDFSFENIDNFSTSSLVTRLTTDITNAQNAFQMIIRMAVRAPLMLIVALFLIFTLSVKIGLIYLGVAFILSLILAFIIKKAFPLFNQAFKNYDKLNESIQENITSIRFVKAYVKEEDETLKLKTASNLIYKTFKKAETYLTFNSPAMQLSMYSCIILVSWVAAKLIVVGDFTTGNLTSVLTYTVNILMSLMMLSMVFVMITMSLASFKRISEVLKEKPNITNKEGAILEVADGSIEFRDVNFKYKKEASENVIEKINLKINSGETIGIIGPTGSGKSTLINLISRLYDVSSGEVLVGGINVKDYDLKTLRDSVAVVLQKNVLFSGTILENLRWGKEDASLEEVKKACDLACASEFIEGFKDQYDTYIEQGGSNVSGGQRQRLCIARALLKSPKILILDDSTSAVDTKTDFKIRKAFKEQIPNTTKIIIAQRIASVIDADKIIVMEDGKITGFASSDELLKTNAMYKMIYDEQLGGKENE